MTNLNSTVTKPATEAQTMTIADVLKKKLIVIESTSGEWGPLCVVDKASQDDPLLIEALKAIGCKTVKSKK